MLFGFRKIKSAIAVFLSLVLFYSMPAAPLAESNVWKERRTSAPPLYPLLNEERTKGVVIAQVPIDSAGLNNALPRVTRDLPDLHEIQNISESSSQRDSSDVHRLPKWLSSLPSQYADIRKIHWVAEDRPIIVLIQDAHEIHSAQKNISQILEYFQQSYDPLPFGGEDSGEGDKSSENIFTLTPTLSPPGRGGKNSHPSLLIALEGAAGSMNLAPYRKCMDPDHRELVAEFLLNRGMISGSEHFAIESAEEPLMRGIETPGLYLENVEAYRDSAAMKNDFEKYIASLEAALNPAKERKFNSELWALDRTLSSYHKGDLDFIHYARFLSNRAGNLKNFPEIKNLLDVLNLETSLDFKKVEDERAQLVQVLSRSLDPRALDDLLQSSKAYRAGRISYGRFYGNLESLADKAGIHLARYPVFSGYIRYVLESDRLDKYRLFTEAEGLKDAILARMGKTPEQKELLRLSEDIHLLAGLKDHSFTEVEWNSYLEKRNEIENIPSRAAALGGAAIDGGALKIYLPVFEKFYAAAEKRNTAMVDNLLKAMAPPLYPLLNEEGTKGVVKVPPAAVLVAGGFHTPGLESILEAKGFSTVTLAPKVGVLEKRSSEYLDFFTLDHVPVEKMLLGEKLFIPQWLDMSTERPVGVVGPTDTAAVAEAIDAAAHGVDASGKSALRRIPGINLGVIISSVREAITNFPGVGQLKKVITTPKYSASVGIIAPNPMNRFSRYKRGIIIVLLLFVLGVGALFARNLLPNKPPINPTGPIPTVTATATIRPASDVLLNENFNEYKDGEVITKERGASSDRNTAWRATSGTLFAQNGTAWTGVPDKQNNSGVLRVVTEDKFGDVDVSFSLLNDGFTSATGDQTNGVHFMARYQDEKTLYYISINRRDNTVIIKKKVEGGPNPVDGGTYYNLTPYVRYTPPGGDNRWQNVRVLVWNDPGSTTVNIELYINDKPIVAAKDDGTFGGPPLPATGHLGIRGDNDEFHIDDFVVTKHVADVTPASTKTSAAPVKTFSSSIATKVFGGFTADVVLLTVIAPLAINSSQIPWGLIIFAGAIIFWIIGMSLLAVAILRRTTPSGRHRFLMFGITALIIGLIVFAAGSVLGKRPSEIISVLETPQPSPTSAVSLNPTATTGFNSSAAPSTQPPTATNRANPSGSPSSPTTVAVQPTPSPNGGVAASIDMTTVNPDRLGVYIGHAAYVPADLRNGTFLSDVIAAKKLGFGMIRANTDIWNDPNFLTPAGQPDLVGQMVQIANDQGVKLIFTFPISNNNNTSAPNGANGGQVNIQGRDYPVGATHYPAKDPNDIYQLALSFGQKYPDIYAVEFWNEPDFKFFWPSGDAKLYYTYFKAFYKGMKDSNSKSRILMGGLSNLFPSEADAFLATFLDAWVNDPDNKGKPFDVIMNIHVYPPTDIFTALKMVRDHLAARNLRAPIWITEMSITGSRYDPGVNIQAMERLKALDLVRNYTALLSSPDVEVGIWHTFWGLKDGQGNPYDFSLQDVNGNPLPAFFAMQQFDNLLIGAQVLGEMQGLPANLIGYRFQKDEREIQVILPKNFPASGSSAYVYHGPTGAVAQNVTLDGKIQEINLTDGVSIKITDAPVYIVFPGGTGASPSAAPSSAAPKATATTTPSVGAVAPAMSFLWHELNLPANPQAAASFLHDDHGTEDLSQFANGNLVFHFPDSVPEGEQVKVQLIDQKTFQSYAQGNPIATGSSQATYTVGPDHQAVVPIKDLVGADLTQATAIIVYGRSRLPITQVDVVNVTTGADNRPGSGVIFLALGLFGLDSFFRTSARSLIRGENNFSAVNNALTLPQPLLDLRTAHNQISLLIQNNESSESAAAMYAVAAGTVGDANLREETVRSLAAPFVENGNLSDEQQITLIGALGRVADDASLAQVHPAERSMFLEQLGTVPVFAHGIAAQEAKHPGSIQRFVDQLFARVPIERAAQLVISDETGNENGPVFVMIRERLKTFNQAPALTAVKSVLTDDGRIALGGTLSAPNVKLIGGLFGYYTAAELPGVYIDVDNLVKLGVPLADIDRLRHILVSLVLNSALVLEGPAAVINGVYEGLKAIEEVLENA